MTWDNYIDYSDPRREQEPDQFYEECTLIGKTRKAWHIEKPHETIPNVVIRAWIAKSICDWDDVSGELTVREWAVIDWRPMSTHIQEEEDVITNHPGKSDEEPPF